jgi:hypothetical protein
VDRDLSNSPGAGTYDPDHSMIMSRKPAYSMLARLPPHSKKVGPGPGNYEFSSELKPTAPKYRFGSSTREGFKTLNVPGPGSYKIRSSIGDVPDYALPNRPDHVKYV